jgi:hypothetical protein
MSNPVVLTETRSRLHLEYPEWNGSLECATEEIAKRYVAIQESEATEAWKQRELLKPFVIRATVTIEMRSEYEPDILDAYLRIKHQLEDTSLVNVKISSIGL